MEEFSLCPKKTTVRIRTNLRLNNVSVPYFIPDANQFEECKIVIVDIDLLRQLSGQIIGF